MATNPIPEGAEGLIPYLLLDGAADAIDFYAKAFDATELFRMPMPGGLIGHAEIEIDGNRIFLADAPEDMPGSGRSPKKLGGSSVLIHRYVIDCDAAFDQAVAAGATPVRPPEDQFYGDRAALVEDPFGHLWSMHTHIRDVPPEEMQAAMEAMGGD
ncbi:MAG TPA: VOC family protein [Acidimicrobiales bacterium]